MKFRILYVILLIASVVMGSIYIAGPIVVKYIAVISMFMVCLLEKVPFPFKNRYIQIYSAFLLIFMITSFAEGYEIDFIKMFLGYYFTTFVWIWATYILIKKYESVSTLIYTLFVICISNAIVTIGQHFMNPIAFIVPEILGVSTYGMDSMFEKSDTTITTFALFGMFGAFQNGFYSAVGAVLSLVLWARKKNIIYLIFMPIAVFGVYCVQERGGFVAGVLFSSSFLYKTLIDSNSKVLKIGIISLTVLALVYLIGYGLNVSSVTEGTRYESFDLDDRDYLYRWSVDYILRHPFDSNLFDFFRIYRHYPHNFIYNSFIYGTFIGGFLIIGCMISLWFKAFKLMIRPINDENAYVMLLSFALFAYCMATFTHNASIVTGDTLFWLLATPIIFMNPNAPVKLNKRIFLKAKR